MYLRFSLLIQFSAIEIRLVFSHAKLMRGSLQWLEKKVGCPCSLVSYSHFFNRQSSISRKICYVFNMCVHEGALNDAINYAQKGCAMQMWVITQRNRKHYLVFYRVIETRVEVWENKKCCGNTSRNWSCVRACIIFSIIVHSTKLLNFDWSRAVLTINPKLYSVGVLIKFPWKPRNFRECTINKKFHDLLVQFVNNSSLFQALC